MAAGSLSETRARLESLSLSKYMGQVRLCHMQVGKSSHFAGQVMEPVAAATLEPWQSTPPS